MKLTEKIFVCLMVALVLPMCLLPLSLRAQSEVLWVDQDSFEPVQKDVVTGLRIDPIGKDRSNRPCARLKIHLNRMTPEDIAATRLKPIGGNAVVMKNMISADQTGLIVEVTAIEKLTFILHSDKFGDSNPITVSLQPNKEYLIKGYCRATYSISIMCATVGAEVYVDRRMAGTIGTDNALTVPDIEVGTHRLELKYNGQTVSKQVEVDAKNILFNLNFSAAETMVNKVHIHVEPAQASFFLNGMALELEDGKKSLSMASGKHDYMVTADEYYPQEGSFVFTGKEPYMLNVRLKPKFGLLDCSAVQPECEVFLDNVSIGKSTRIRQYHIPLGRHALRFEADRYTTGTYPANVTSGMTVRPELSLEPQFAEFQVAGPWAKDSEIKINGIDILPEKVYRMDPGTYNVKIHRYLYHDYSETIVLKKGGKTILNPEMDADFARLRLNVGRNAEIRVDGRLVGRGNCEADIPTGRHEFVCSLPNHTTTNRVVDINPSMNGRVIMLDTPELKSGTVRITSEPSYLSVYIDGEKVGMTPFDSSEVPAGEHTVTLQDVRTSIQSSFQIDIAEDKVYTYHKKVNELLKKIKEEEDRKAKEKRKVSKILQRQNKPSYKYDDWEMTGFKFCVDLTYGMQLRPGYVNFVNSGKLKYMNFSPLNLDLSVGFQFTPHVAVCIGGGIIGNLTDLKKYERPEEDSQNGPSVFDKDYLAFDYYRDHIYERCDLSVFTSGRFNTNPLGHSKIHLAFSATLGYYVFNELFLGELGAGFGTRMGATSKFDLLLFVKTTPWPNFSGDQLRPALAPTLGVKTAFTF